MSVFAAQNNSVIVEPLEWKYYLMSHQHWDKGHKPTKMVCVYIVTKDKQSMCNPVNIGLKKSKSADVD